MVLDSENEAKKVRVFDYTSGFRMGARGVEITLFETPDLKRGYEEGVAALKRHYEDFCREIGFVDLDREKQRRALDYAEGFRKGASLAYIYEVYPEDLKRGHIDGRRALNSAHQSFCGELGYDSGLSVLR